jgi:tRNA dimethylallyltransferase
MSNYQIVQQKPLIICGPTASGKTSLALELARIYDGELISADSRQIYKYLDIGTNKGDVEQTAPGQFEIEGVKIYLVSFLNPDQDYSMKDFVLAAEAQIADCLSRGKLPIVVGGTGLYIDALIRGYQLGDEQQDSQLRTELNSLSVSDLQARVLPEQLATLNASDRQNPRRLIRLIEKQQTAISTSQTIGGRFAYQIIFVDKSISEIEDKLKHRVGQMWSDGIVEEVRQVLALGFPNQSIALQGIGYRQVLAYLNGDIDSEKCQELIYLAHRQYAKRQLTWFRKFLNPTTLQHTRSSLID